MPQPRLYIFDFGDTLVAYPLSTVDSQLEYLRKFAASLSGSNVLSITPDALANLVANLNVENSDHSVHAFVERIRKDYLLGTGISVEQGAELEERILEGVFRGSTPIANALEVIKALKQRGSMVAIMSNLPWGTSSGLWRSEFARYGFTKELMDAIVTCMDVGFRKPHPAGIQRILEELHVSANEAVFIGDNSNADMAAAYAAGVTPILFDTTGKKPLPDGVSTSISSLNELVQ